MGKKILWLVVSCLMVLSLVMASCGTTAEEEEEEKEETGPAEVPQYGGTFNAASVWDTNNWDACTGFDLLGWQISITNEPLMAGDWARGPAGTGETDWQYGSVGYAKMSTGQLAESYEIPDNETLIFHIRKGVKWWDKPPANGRELNAEDVAWNIKTQWELETGNFKAFFPPEERLISVRALDDYTVELKVPLNTQGVHFWEDGQRCYIMLPELYPNQKEWENNLGTGAFMVTDYLRGSSMTLEKNPNYWQTNPCGPGKGNQLPYIDKLNILIISDLSTRLAAFRTGKIDEIQVTWEQWEEFQDNMSYEFEYAQTYGSTELPTGREDKDLPFNNLLVRQAMNLAVDKETILKDYYQGHGLLKGWPYYDTPAFDGLYTPLEEMPTEPTIEGSRCGVQELIKGGNPEKAKELLAEAGYPDGFRTSIYAGNMEDADFLSIIKEYLAEVGIDMEIKTVEFGVYQSIERGRTWEEMFYKPTKQYFLPHYLFELRPESNDCAAYFESPETREVLKIINENLAVNDEAWRKALKDLTPFVLEQAIAIWMPVEYKYNCWQPWLKNYYGANRLAAFLPYHYTYYNWIDQDLKAKILGK